MTLSEFQKKIDYKFKDMRILETAFIHRSFLNENREVNEHNERLEFLGDAVLELIATEFLFRKFPQKPEGEMTTLRSALVRGEQLAEVAREIGAGSLLRFSKGEAKSGGADKPYLLANVFEAILGAVYLDAGYEKTREIVEKFLFPKLEKIIEEGTQTDAKSNFQEFAQAKFSITPQYKIISEIGPDHAKIFRMGVYVGDQLFGVGEGINKQAAEQVAAAEALKKLK